MRSIIERDKKGQMVMINLLFLVMTVAILVALAPALNSMMNIMKQSDSLNCAGYIHNGDSGNVLSYNSSLNTDTIACLSLTIYLPYIILAVLIMGVGSLGTNRLFGGQTA